MYYTCIWSYCSYICTHIYAMCKVYSLETKHPFEHREIVQYSTPSNQHCGISESYGQIRKAGNGGSILKLGHPNSVIIKLQTLVNAWQMSQGWFHIRTIYSLTWQKHQVSNSSIKTMPLGEGGDHFNKQPSNDEWRPTLAQMVWEAF